MPRAAGLINPSKSWLAVPRLWTRKAGFRPNSVSPTLRLGSQTCFRSNSPMVLADRSALILMGEGGLGVDGSKRISEEDPVSTSKWTER